VKKKMLAQAQPSVVGTAEQHERMLDEIEGLMDNGNRRTPEEDAALDLMVRLVRDYEDRHHPLPDPS
jgi:HTH-type transcriptional regulator/antitoxin HigA